MKIKHIYLATILVSLIIGSATAQARLDHIPVGFSFIEEPINVTARLEFTDSESAVESAKVWYKTKSEVNFNFVEMLPYLDEYSGDIPEEATVATELTYFIEFVTVKDSKTDTLTFPTVSPSTVPLEIALSERPAGLTRREPGLMILTPSPNTVVKPGDLSVMMLIEKNKFKIAPAKITLRIDGDKVKGGFTVDDDILYTTIKDVAEGSHLISLTADGRVLVKWSIHASDSLVQFPQSGIKKAKKKRKIFWGSVGTTLSSQDLNGKSRQIGREFANISGRAGSWKYKVSGQLSSEESTKLQPQNRYSIQVGTGVLSLKLLDSYPRYNELMLWGKRTRGAEIDLRGKSGSLSIIYGELMRAVDSEITSIDTSWNNSDPLNPLVQSIDTTQNAGTFKRWMGAMRFSIGNPNEFNVGLTAMKVRDDETSIIYGYKPKDNLVGGLDLRWFLADKRVDISATAAWSFYCDNIYDAPFAAAESVKDIIWINQNFIPTPNDTSENKTKILTDGIKNSLSWQTKIRMNFLGNYFNVRLYKLNKSYYSLGLPTLSRDRQGFSVGDNVSLLNNKLSLSGNLDFYHDNLSGEADETNSGATFNLGMSIRAGGFYPDLSLSYNGQNDGNDADTLTISSGDPANPSYSIIDNRKNNNGSSVAINLSKEYQFLASSTRFNMGMSNSSFSDEYDELNESNQDMIFLGFTTKQDKLPLTMTFNYSTSGNRSVNEMTDLKSDVFSLRFETRHFNGKLKPYVSYRNSKQSGPNRISPISPNDTYNMLGYDMTDPDNIARLDTLNLTTVRDVILDESRNELRAGFGMNLNKVHEFRVDWRMVSYTSDNSNRYWNDAEYEASEQVITNSDGINTVTFDQREIGTRDNDMIFTMNYSYRF